MGERRGGGRLARMIGWFGAGLAVPSLLAPEAVSRSLGLRPTGATTALVRAVGVQELAVAAGLLRRRRPVGWQWIRVAGDVAHLVLLGNALQSRDGDRRRIGRATAAVLVCLALDLVAGVRQSRRSATPSREQPVQGRRVLTIRRPPEEVYRYWRDFTNLPSFMAHVRSVETSDGGRRSHWVANAPAGAAVEWDAEIVEDVAGELISWRSLEGADVSNRGTVRFLNAPGDQGTEVHVELRYDPPGGPVGRIIAKLFGEEPEQQIADDLRRFKQILETGEVVRSDGSPEGPSTLRLLQQHPAQPSADEG